jgi:sulfate permease, SulP family
MMALAGWLRFGTYVKYIPYPVVVGFTAGIAVIIFSSQISELLGLTLAGKEPGEIIPKLIALFDARTTISPSACLVAATTVVIVFAVKAFQPRWPNLLLAVAAASLLAWALHLPVATIGSRFGGIPATLPSPHLPSLSVDKVVAVLPDALSFALLGAIESLLSAVVADGMTGRRHRSNVELIAQGIANFGSALFGGFCVTGTIARTATNVRAGAVSPISGMVHALFLLVFMLFLSPLARYVPLAALAGVLAAVTWNMVEKPAIAALLRSSRGDALVLIATFATVVFRDLTEGILVGFVLGAVLFIDRMGKTVKVSATARAAYANGETEEHPVPYDDPDVVAYHINGVFFFGAASTVGSVLDRIADTAKVFILDCASVPFIDSTAANVIEGIARKAERRGMRFVISGASAEARGMLQAHNLAEPHVHFFDTIDEAFAASKASIPAGAAAH